MKFSRDLPCSQWAARDYFSNGLGLGALAFSLALTTRAQEAMVLDPVAITARNDVAWLNRPEAITARSGEFLAENGIVDYRELARIVPGFFVTEQSVDNVSLNLRGLTSDTGDPRMQPRVSVYQDGVVLGNAHGNGVALFDVGEVAVHKGPQATQFARGVQSGALALASRRAANANTAELSLGACDYQAKSAEFTVNRALVPDKLFARVAVIAKEREGYVTNLAGGPDLQGEGTVAGRASVRWQPSPATAADLILSYQRDDTPTIALKTATGIPELTPAVDHDPYTATNLNRADELGIQRTIVGVTGIVRQTFNDVWTLFSTSAWRTVKSSNKFDIDGSPHSLLDADERFDGRQLSEELRLEYDRGGKLKASAGATVFASKDTQTATVSTNENTLYRYFTGTVLPVLLNPRYTERTSNEARLSSADVFGRAEYRVTKPLVLGGGLRLTQERIGSRYLSPPAPVRGNLVGVAPTSGGPNNFFKPTNGWLTNSADAQSWAGQLDARYEFAPQRVGFATVSRGRHAPVLAFDLVTLAPTRTAEETVWSYEIGFKGTSANRRLRYEASAFYYDFAHFQTQRVVTTGVTAAFDGGRARGQGFEVSVQADVRAGLTVFANYGFTDAEFADTDENGGRQLFAGYRFRLTSRHVVSMGGTATLPLARRGAFFVTPLVTYRSEYFFEDDHAQSGGILRQGGHALVNLRCGYRPAGGRWEVAAYATNLLDKNYLLDAGNIGAAYGAPTTIRAAPRMAGVKVIRQF